MVLIFEGMAEADAFIRAQSPNPEWRSRWSFTYTNRGTVSVISSEPGITIDFPRSPVSQ